MADTQRIVTEYRKFIDRQRWMHRILSLFGQRPARHRVSWHQFRRQPVATHAQIAAFEAKWGIVLPEDYKMILTTVGNGGAGPVWGLSSLDEWHQPFMPDEFDEDVLRQPFDPALTDSDDLAPGALRICNVGCEYYILLVVSGAHAGTLWLDGRIDGHGLLPLHDDEERPLALLPWLSDWMHALRCEGAELGDRHALWKHGAFGGHAAQQALRKDTETIAVDQLPCPACVSRIAAAPQSICVIVPIEESRPYGSPKVAAMRAAAGLCAVKPKQVMP